jgi:hypothetical protein
MAYTGFKKLEGQLANRQGVTNPAALAASIGRKKYGQAAMANASRSGTSLKGQPPFDGRAKKVAAFVGKAPKVKPKITEDSPGWNPKTMGNKRGALPKRIGGQY